MRPDKIITAHGGNCKRSHPLISYIGRFSWTVVEEELKQSLNANTVRYPSESKLRTSAVGCIQLNIDKSQISLAAGSLEFHPSHATLLGMRERKRGLLIMMRKTSIAYLPVSLQK